MYGFAFELVMEKLLIERGYKILKVSELGFDPSEMLEIAEKYAPVQYSKVLSYFGEETIKRMSCKDILDHFFKVDTILEIKKGEVIGLQFVNYDERSYQSDTDKKIKYKIKQLKYSWQACQELFIARTYVVAGYVPSTWEGLGLRTDNQNELIKLTVLKLIKEVSKPREGPHVIHISFEF